MDRALLSEDALFNDRVMRTSIVRATMVSAAKRTMKYNWFAAGATAKVMPGMSDLVSYGTNAAVAYHEEGMILSEALAAGMKLMGNWAWNEGRGVVTKTKGYVAKDHKYGIGVTVAEELEPGMIELRIEDFLLVDQIASIDMEPEEKKALLMTAHDFTPAEMREIIGENSEDILRCALDKAKEVWDG